ncbi:hypothetical protein KIPE111705_33580 [Kibdelosporangium persicum]
MTLNETQQLLLSAAEAGRVPEVEELGPSEQVAEHLAQLARTPLAPLAASVLVRAMSGESAGQWGSTARSFAASTANQTSVLALADTLDALLDPMDVAVVVGPGLHDAMLRDFDQSVASQPQLAATRLEGALRVALSGVTTPYLVLDRLTRTVDGLPLDFAEVLPRLLGAALDTWSGDEALTQPLRTTLHGLAEMEELGADATFELGCDALRSALNNTDENEVLAGLDAATALFAAASTLEENRDDAAVYREACRAVVAFARRDEGTLAASAVELERLLNLRRAWHFNTHMPNWRINRIDAETAWLSLVLDLRTAAGRLAEATWLDTWNAVAELCSIYEAERPRMPRITTGLGAVISPIVENAIAENAALLDQLKRAVQADRKREQPVLPAAADALLAAIRDREGCSGRSALEADDDAESDPARLQRTAPSLLRLEPGIQAQLLATLNDDGLTALNTLVEAASPVSRHPALSTMRARIIGQLELDQRFVGEARAAVVALLERTLTFLLDRYNRGGPLAPGMKDIIKKIKPGDQIPIEADLQQEFYIWLAAPWEFAGRVHTEVSDVSTGRVDVSVRIGEIVLSTEVKREDTNASQENLDKYLAQAAEYSGSNVPFSQLLVLDISDHQHGSRSLEECMWTRSYSPVEDAAPRQVIAGVVIGNRPTPRFLKTQTEGALRSTSSAAASRSS